MMEKEELFMQLEEEKQKLAREKRCLQVSKYKKTKEKIALLMKQLEQIELDSLDKKIASCSHYFIEKKFDGELIITCLSCGLTNEKQSNEKVQNIMDKYRKRLIPKIKIECSTKEQMEQVVKTYQEVLEQYPKFSLDLLEEEITLRIKRR